jgi:hypothetical protein
MRKSASVLHFRKSPKYSSKFVQYLSESELAVGTKRIFGFLLFDRRMISRSIGAVPLVLMSPPPGSRQSPLAWVHLSLKFEPHSVHRDSCSDKGLLASNCWKQAITLTTPSMSVMAMLRQQSLQRHTLLQPGSPSSIFVRPQI